MFYRINLGINTIQNMNIRWTLWQHTEVFNHTPSELELMNTFYEQFRKNQYFPIFPIQIYVEIEEYVESRYELIFSETISQSSSGDLEQLMANRILVIKKYFEKLTKNQDCINKMEKLI